MHRRVRLQVFALLGLHHHRDAPTRWISDALRERLHATRFMLLPSFLMHRLRDVDESSCKTVIERNPLNKQHVAACNCASELCTVTAVAIANRALPGVIDESSA